MQEMDGAVDAVDDGLAVGTNRILMGSDQKLQGCSGTKPFTGKTAMFLVTPTIEGTWRLNGCDNCVRPSSGWFPPPSDPLSRRLESSGIDSSRNQQLTPASVASAKRRPAEHQFVKPLSLLI